jgi:glycosyltransferase involved in cell wall biosynthesis
MKKIISGYMTKIKVANIIEDARLGGPQVRIAEVARALITHDCETTVIFPKKDNERFKAKLDSCDVKYKELSLHRLTKEKVHLFLFIVLFVYEVFSLYRYLKQEKFDIIHVSGGCWQWKGIIAGWLARCKVIWHLNDTSSPRFVRFVFNIISKYFVDGFIVAGERVASYYSEGIGQRRCTVIEAPVNTNFFDKQKIDSINDVIKRVIMVSNINPVKGIDTFLKVCKEVGLRTKHVEFLLVGPVYNSQKVYYQSMLSLYNRLGLPNLKFIEGVDDVRSLLESADLYLCTSVAEASPISVWEALSMSLPVVSTDVGSVKKYVVDGVNGYVLEVNDVVGIADEIVCLLSQPSKLVDFGLSSRKMAVENLDLKICATKHFNFYSQILDLKS